ncbi:MAG: branched-chain amino acid ABC transporter permease [Alphaproteobacteria bacterium]
MSISKTPTSGSDIATDTGFGANLKTIVVAVIAVAVLAIVPMWLGPYWTRVGGTILMFVALAQSWNLIGGYVGLMSLAHSAFFGLGAIGTTILLINGLPFFVAALGGVLLAAVVAFAVGAPTLRLQGHYFVIATLLISEALLNGIRNLNFLGFRGAISHNIMGHIGLTDLSAAAYNQLFFYVMAALAGFSILVVWFIERSKWGFALRAIRDAEGAAACVGISVAGVKLAIFVISAAIAGMVGVASAAWLGIVDATSAFDVTTTFQVIVMVFLGGRGTLLGPIIGVVVVFSLNELIGIELAEISTIIAGLIVVATVLLLPDGLVEVYRKGPSAISIASIRQNLIRYKVK